MLIRQSYDTRFLALMERLRKQYGERMFELAGIGDNDLDINNFSQKFFNGVGNTADKTIDGNANVAHADVLGWETESAKPIKKLNSLYLLWRSALTKHGIKRANKLIELDINGAIRIHDAHLWLRPYCYASSLSLLVDKGMPFYDKIKIGPIKHFDSFINLSLQYICFTSNQIAGAIALPDFFVYAEYFVRKDYGEEWYKDVKTLEHVNQQFQSWIYSVNFSWRSNQSPFTNLSVMDKHWLANLFSMHANPDFSPINIDNTLRVQKMFVDEMVRNLKNNPFTFPVMTACILTDKDGIPLDAEFEDFVADINARTGLFNFYADNNTASLSSCCRLRNNIEEANKQYINSFGSGGLNIGSHRVVCLNLPRLAYESENWKEFFSLLEYNAEVSQDILDIHRETIQDLADRGYLPLYKYNYMHLDKQFSTLGFIGMNEALEIMGLDIAEDSGSKKGQEILQVLNELNLKRSKADGKIRNIEQIPGESAASNFAFKDKLMFPENKFHYELYSNQYIPLTKTVDMVDRVVAQGKFDKNVGGGSILHINIDQEITKDQVKKLIRFAASKGVIYFAINYNFSQCTNCGKVYVGKMDKSPCHDADVKRFLRVVGFLTEVAHWSKERRNEYPKRQFYDNTKT